MLFYLLCLVMLGRAAEVVVNPPVALSASSGLAATATNNDLGAIYDSMEWHCFSQLAHQLHGISGNSATHPDVVALMNSWTLGVSGQVDNNWSAHVTSEAVLSTEHIDGDPGFDYDVMSTGRSQTVLVAVPYAQLELNAVSGYQKFTLADVQDSDWDPALYDAIIVRSDSPLLSQRNLTRARPPVLMEEAFVGFDAGFGSWSASGHYYELLTPEDFAAWTDFASEHPGLDPNDDDNGNGRSNFLDYASGQDPEAAGLLPIVALSGTTLTLRQRINGLDAAPLAEYSDNLSDWYPLEEGVHYTLTKETVSGMMRTLELELLPGPPATRFFRQRFEP